MSATAAQHAPQARPSRFAVGERVSVVTCRVSTGEPIRLDGTVGALPRPGCPRYVVDLPHGTFAQVEESALLPWEPDAGDGTDFKLLDHAARAEAERAADTDAMRALVVVVDAWTG